MKKLSVLVLLLTLSSVAFAEKSTTSKSSVTKPRCSKRSSEILCSGVVEAKREYFCWKGKKSVTGARKIKICKTMKRKHKRNKKSQKGS
jgi:hypothetical protein